MNDSLTLASGGLTSGTIYSSGTSTYITNPSTSFYIDTNMNKPTQNKVAVFKVTRNDDNEITSTEFIKEMWVQTKNSQSVEFEVARDKDLAKYKAEDLSIRVIYTVTF